MMMIRSLLSAVLLIFLFGDLDAKVIPVTNPNVMAGLSPYNWVCKDGLISSSVNGASLTIHFKGTGNVALTIDTRHMVFQVPDRFPIIAWSVNGKPVQSRQLRSDENSIPLCSGIIDPVIELYIKGMSPFEDRYNSDVPPNSVRISGFKVDEGGVVAKPGKQKKIWLTIGDSILSGDGAALTDNQGRPADDQWAASDEARASYGYLLAQHFGYRESRLAFGGYNWGGGMAGVPALNILIDSATSSVGRLNGDRLDPAPDVVLINLGENGAPAEKDVTDALKTLRSRVAKNTKIMVMVPVSGRARSQITKAFYSYQSSVDDKYTYLIDLQRIWFDTCDGQHPTANGHVTIYKATLPVVDAILGGSYTSPVTIPLWSGSVPESQGRPEGENPVITVYRPVKPNGAAVIICPGGGYGMLVTGPEGQGIAQWLNNAGITGIVLEYRLPKGNSRIPLLDAQQAIRLVRSKAGEWHLDPDRIGIAGFSAGGHLASTAATHYDTGVKQSPDPISRMSSRPDFAILVYPVITMGPKTHEGSKRNLLGPDPSDELVKMFSNEAQITPETPPAFLAHALDDGAVSPDNSSLFYEALVKNNVPARYLKLPSGDHGLNGYKGPMWDEWQKQSLKWMAGLKIIQSMPVHLDVTTADSIISPLLFGHNLEVTRRGVWSGLSAEMVANRKFAAAENNLPRRWQPVGGQGSVMLDTIIAYAGKQSVRIAVPEDASPAGIHQQQEQLSFQKDTEYGVRIYLKTEKLRQLHVSLTDENSHLVFEKTFSCIPGDWELLNTEFRAAATEANCHLKITSGEPGIFWIGTISILPADAFHGMRRDVIARLKLLKPGILRFPGGCYAEFYNWKDGLLPVDQRPPISNTGLDFLFRDTDGTDNQEIGIDEFIALCREVDCESAITVRLSDNLPEDAAAWVEYCNGDAAAKWGNVRMQRGHPEPYQVKWWFVGNELAWFGRGAAGKAAGCASQSRLFAEAMKSIDSSVRLVPSTYFINGKASSEWNTPLLEAAGPYLHAVSAHQYILDQLTLQTAADYSAIISAPRLHTLPLLLLARQSVDSIITRQVKPGISYDEWNTIWGSRGTVPMGLYAAGMLNMLCREGPSLGVDLACYFMPVNEGAIRVEPLTANLDPAGLVFSLFSVHQGNRLMHLSGHTGVDLCASLSSDGKQIFVTAVNDIISGQTISFSLDKGVKVKSRHVLVKLLVPHSLDINENLFDSREEEVAITKNNQFEIKLPPGAVARIIVGGSERD